MNSLLFGLKDRDNYTLTENGAVTHKTTNSAVLDMFGMGGSMLKRSEEDIILMFKKAYEENPVYALKCLFYLRDARQGQGQRRFFRTVYHWLAKNDTEAARRNMPYLAEYGRYDDFYCLVDTPLEKEMFDILGKQLLSDYEGKTLTLVAKWLKSENTSSKESRALARKTREALGLSPRFYRQILSSLRARIKIVETYMSQNQWDKIDFSKLPSKAGLKYRRAFQNRPETKIRYEQFMAQKETKVNASVLNPVDIAKQIFSSWCPSPTDRNVWQKYWDALPDYYAGKEEPGIAVVDVSGSMSGEPIAAAVSLGAYVAERGNGPFKNHFITFSDNPQLVEFNGVDIYDKFKRAERADWGGSTNIEAVFDLLLSTAVRNHVKHEDMPKVLYIFSDMEFNMALHDNSRRSSSHYSFYDYSSRMFNEAKMDTLIERKMTEWKAKGYEVPRIIFWNLRAAQANIPALGSQFSYVSGYSPVMISQILGGKTGYELMMEKLDTERYAVIH